MGSRVLGILVVLLALILLISSSTFIVGEQERAVRVRLSQIKGADFDPGLQFKIPFMDRVVKFDKRVLTRKFNAEQFLTRESQGLTVDYYIKWRIVDAETYRPTELDERRRAVYRQGGATYTEKSLAALSALPRFRDRVTMAGSLAFPSRQFLSDRGLSYRDWLRHGIHGAMRARRATR